MPRRSIDVTTAREVGFAGAPDEEQLVFASTEGRVLVTHDADFLCLHAAGRPYASSSAHQRTATVGGLVRGLALIHAVLSPTT